MSTLKVNAITDVAGTSGPNVEVANTAKAWVNFQGTGTVAIRASYNVSSITDNGVGIYTLAFTNALEDDKYCANVSAIHNTGPVSAQIGGPAATGPNNKSTTELQVRALTAADTFIDCNQVSISIFR